MNRREFMKVSCAMAAALAGTETLTTLMAKRPSGGMIGEAFAGSLPMNRLNVFAEDAIKRKQHAVGYPVNQDLNMKDFYAWYVDSGLCNVSMNNVGNPRKEGSIMNTHAFENEVIDYFAPLFGFKADETWGIVTHSGTDGNMHGMYFGVKYLQAQTKQLPIVYVSEQAHYSIKKLADMMNLELRIIPTAPMGQMDVDAFEKAIDPKKPALVVVAIGTTFKGAIDDHPAIAAALGRANPPAVYTMLDAALFGGYLPFSPFKDVINRQKLPFDAIAVSGHKFFGFDEPLGLFITTKTVYSSQNPFQVPYLNDAVPTITCSRSALGALKFWWQMTRNGEKEYARQASYILEIAKYQKNKLDEMKYPAWLNPMSNTVFYKRPGEWIMKKWGLAPDHDQRLGGNLAHDILMQHESRETIDEFIIDLKQDVSRGGVTG
jgi:histidine decarboxylase